MAGVSCVECRMPDVRVLKFMYVCEKCRGRTILQGDGYVLDSLRDGYSYAHRNGG